MNTLKKIILFAFITTLFVTCKKEELPPSTVAGQPVFSFTGNIGANVLNLQAGVNNYYMFATYTQDSGAYNFTGTLKNTATKNNSIQIIINDYKTSTLNASVKSHIDSSLSTTALYYYKIPGGNPLHYSVTFKPIIYSGTPQTFSYNFGDGGSASTTNIKPVTHIYTKLQIDTASLAVKFSNGKTITILNPVNLIKQAKPLIIDSIHCGLGVDDSVKQDSLTAFFTGGSPPYSYIWYFGDAKTDTSIGTTNSTSVSRVHNYTISAKSTAPDTVIFLVKDANNTIITHRILIQDTINDPSICRMNYFASLPTPVPNPSALSNIIINYTDGQGNVYTSNNALQPLTSTFQVLSVSDYQNNIYNNPTKMLNVVFTCRLYNGNNYILASGTATIAVAYQ